MSKRKFQLSGATKAFRTKLNNKRMCGALKGLANSLKSKRGESIMEVIVSILIFSILMTTALAVVRTSLIITGGRIAEATTLQHEINDLLLADWSDSDIVPGEIRITFSDDENNIDSSHLIDLYDDDGSGRLVFRPR